MPANLTPQFLAAELAYRHAQNPIAQLEALRAMLREIPKHKGTDRMQADLKSKIAKLRVIIDQVESSIGRGDATSSIAKQGVGRIVMIGPPSAGKTTLLRSLTRAKVVTGTVPFSTRSAQVGMIQILDCPIQLIDLPSMGYPPTESDLAQWVRTADVVWLVIDFASVDFIEQSQTAIDRFSSEKTKLGLATELDKSCVGLKTVSTILVATQLDRVIGVAERDTRLHSLAEFISLPLPVISISGLQTTDLESLCKCSIKMMQIVRIYCKHPKETSADFEKPLFIREGESLQAFAVQIHGSIADRMKGAKLWDTNCKSFRVVKPDYQPSDGDVIELLTA